MLLWEVNLITAHPDMVYSAYITAINYYFNLLMNKTLCFLTINSCI